MTRGIGLIEVVISVLLLSSALIAGLSYLQSFKKTKFNLTDQATRADILRHQLLNDLTSAINANPPCPPETDFLNLNQALVACENLVSRGSVQVFPGFGVTELNALAEDLTQLDYSGWSVSKADSDSLRIFSRDLSMGLKSCQLMQPSSLGIENPNSNGFIVSSLQQPDCGLIADGGILKEGGLYLMVQDFLDLNQQRRSFSTVFRVSSIPGTFNPDSQFVEVSSQAYPDINQSEGLSALGYTSEASNQNIGAAYFFPMKVIEWAYAEKFGSDLGVVVRREIPFDLSNWTDSAWKVIGSGYSAFQLYPITTKQLHNRLPAWNSSDSQNDGPEDILALRVYLQELNTPGNRGRSQTINIANRGGSNL